jgi:protein TonB
VIAGLVLVLMALPVVTAADGPRSTRDAVEVGPFEMRIAPRPVPPAYRYAPPPRYPIAARERGLQGVVVLSVLVRSDGRVDAARVASSSGAAALDEAALAAVRTWVFAPARQGDLAVESVVEVPVKFALRAP